METTNEKYLLEEEIERAFQQVNEEETRAAYVLSLMRLKPIEQRLFDRYKTWVGDGRLRFPPMAVLKSMLLKELKSIGSFQQLITYLCTNQEESTLLGFDKFLPSNQTFSIIKSEKIDQEIRQLMDFVIEKIRCLAKENGRHLDIDFILYDNRRGKSRRTIQRHVSRQGGKVVRYMKKIILPQLMLPSDRNHKYKNNDLVDALGFMAERNICANQGCNIMRNDDKFKSRAMHGRTLLGRLAKMHPADIRSQAINFFDTIFRLAKSRGLVPTHPVVLALDYTDIPYYGDSNKYMVVEGKPEKGTYHKHRYAVIKISAKYGDLFLLALPIGVLTQKRETIRELIEFAQQRVRIKHIVVDKAFFNSKYISLFDEMGVKYLMPGVKNKRIVKLINKGIEATKITIRSKNKKYVAHIGLAFRKATDDTVVCFATNLPPLMLYGSNLFDLYKRRWNIETGFRVIKHEFMAKTTSRRYKIRMFLFMFSMLLYNIWVIVNAAMNKMLYGRQEGLKLISAKLFMLKFYQSYVDYVHPPVDI
jgi:hypothetical protein